eukprot:gene14970-16513_t
MAANHHGKHYRNKSNEIQLIYGKKFVDSLPWKVTDKVLDVGCGTGQLAEHVAQNKVPQGHVTGVDPDSNRLEIAKENSTEIHNISFYVATALEFMRSISEKQQENCCNYYDVIYSNSVLNWVAPKDLRPTFQALYKFAKPGGIIAHQFKSEESKFFQNLKTLLDNGEKECLDNLFRHLPSEMMLELAVSCGFEVVSHERIKYEKEFKDVEEYLFFVEATFHGHFPLLSKYEKAKEKFDVFKYENGNTVRWEIVMMRIVLKKPVLD